MELVQDRWALRNMDMCESPNYKSKLINDATSTPWQKKRPTLTTNIHGEKQSPFFLARAIAVAMAIHFIAMLMISSVIVTNSSFNQPASISLNESYCGPCPKDWICYRNSCYQFFSESKSWFQSQASCISQNASLLKIYSKEDQDFFKLVKSFHWIGLRQNSTAGTWQWEDGSILSSNQLTLVDVAKGSCAVYGSSFKGYTENCSTPNTYICMQRTV